MRPAAAGLAAIVGFLLAGPPAPSAKVRNVAVEGTAFRITLSDGRVLDQQELQGIRLQLGDGAGHQRTIRIDAIERDARDPTGEIVLYKFSEQNPASGKWDNLCQPDREGRRLGFPMSGAFAQDGRYVAEPGRLLITCTGGAEGKCVRFGYKPWRHGPNGVSLGRYYQACVRLVRADYCGDGIGHTRNGTPIDLFDKIGIQHDEAAPGMSFEAAWGPEGAVCVRHTRFPQMPDLSALAAQCPRLAGRVGASCSDAMPAILYTRSFGYPPLGN
jgi:hypothetical protein